PHRTMVVEAARPGYDRRLVPESLLIRTWNLAHGRDVPPGAEHGHVRRKLLREMAQVMIEDGPDVVLLQEVPVWAADLLREHTGMGVTLAPTYGAHIPFVHVPLPLALGAAVGRALPDLVRTQVEGQAQAILYGPALLLVSARRVQLNERTRLRGEPRIAQLARLRHRRAGRELAIADLNADVQSAGVHALRARGFVEESGEVGIDHVLVRNFEVEWAATRWLPERRDLRHNGSRPVRLSDHDPVDAVVSFA